MRTPSAFGFAPASGLRDRPHPATASTACGPSDATARTASSGRLRASIFPANSTTKSSGPRAAGGARIRVGPRRRGTARRSPRTVVVDGVRRRIDARRRHAVALEVSREQAPDARDSRNRATEMRASSACQAARRQPDGACRCACRRDTGSERRDVAPTARRAQRHRVPARHQDDVRAACPRSPCRWPARRGLENGPSRSRRHPALANQLPARSRRAAACPTRTAGRSPCPAGRDAAGPRRRRSARAPGSCRRCAGTTARCTAPDGSARLSGGRVLDPSVVAR